VIHLGCAWFFACNEAKEVIYEGRCEPGFYFDAEGQYCNFQEEVECTNPWVPSSCPNTSNVTVIPHPDICSKYTVCFERIMNDRNCPVGLHYSYYDGGCVDPRLADCQTEKKLCKESIENNNLPKFFENERSCGSYFLCLGEKAVVLRCAPGSQFDVENNWCDNEKNIECKPTIPEDVPEIPDKESVECSGKSGITIPHPDSCQFYVFCAGDRSYLQLCGNGLVFDINTGRCQIKSDETLCVKDILT
jgi:hypothetical protein